ncbi:MAG: phosphotransferase family protein [Novosphingobium sp.]|nr:phosphotransferase family protein [Novosphingobium sp.]
MGAQIADEASTIGAGEAIAGVDNDRLMRWRLLSIMARTLASDVLPYVADGDARDTLENAIRTLALIAVQDGWSQVDTDEFAAVAGLAAPTRQAFAWFDLCALRAMALDADAVRGVSAEADLQQRIAARRDAIVCRADEGEGKSGNPPSAIGERLEAYLKREIDSRISLDAVERVPGGRSKQTYFLELSGSDRLPGQVVLRLDRESAFVQTEAADEFPVLKRLAETPGIPVPAPLHVEADRSVLGGSFLLLTRSAGRKAGEYFPEVHPDPDRREDVICDVGAILGRLHALDPALFGLEGAPVGQDAILQMIEGIHERTRDAGLRAAEFEAAYRWLKDHAAACETISCFTHGDIGLHNLLVDHGRVTALLDWELAGPAAAASDLGSFRHVVERAGVWERFRSAYLDHGGSTDAVRPDHLNFYTIFRLFKINQASSVAGSMFRRGITDDFVLGNAGFDLAARGRFLLASAMKRIVGE